MDDSYFKLSLLKDGYCYNILKRYDMKDVDQTIIKIENICKACGIKNIQILVQNKYLSYEFVANVGSVK